jgi:hypothetical protein
MNDLARLLAEAGIGTAPRVFAARLRAKGWLLPSGQRGVWEFAPAAVAGPYSARDPLLPLKSFLARHENAGCALTFQASAWAHGLADRIPGRPEVAVADAATGRKVPDALDPSVFAPTLPVDWFHDAPALPLESVVAHMCAKPNAVRSWASAIEWLPDVCAELDRNRLAAELTPRSGAVRVRAGYLLQSLRPDLAEAIRKLPAPNGKTWFGSRGPLRRHDNHWQIADTLLPFDPRRLEAAR